MLPMWMGGGLEIMEVVGVAEMRCTVLQSIGFALKNDLPTHFRHQIGSVLPRLTYIQEIQILRVSCPLRPADMSSFS
jgi:hypothetical protein